MSEKHRIRIEHVGGSFSRYRWSIEWTALYGYAMTESGALRAARRAWRDREAFGGRGSKTYEVAP